MACPPPPSFSNRIICGNCIEVMAQMPRESVDFILTDPPYGSRYRDRTQRTVTNDDRTAYLKPAFLQMARLLKRDRFLVSFYGWSKVDSFMEAWRAAGLRPRAHFVWVKRYASSKNIVEYRHEQAFLLGKGEPRWPNAVLPDVLEWRYTGNQIHPTQKPIMALRPLISAFSDPGDLVLDPFAGSGSTAYASIQLGRCYAAIEIEPGYCDAAIKRISRFPTTGSERPITVQGAA